MLPASKQGSQRSEGNTFDDHLSKTDVTRNSSISVGLVERVQYSSVGVRRKGLLQRLQYRHYLAGRTRGSPPLGWKIHTRGIPQCNPRGDNTWKTMFKPE